VSGGKKNRAFTQNPYPEEIMLVSTGLLCEKADKTGSVPRVCFQKGKSVGEKKVLPEHRT